MTGQRTFKPGDRCRINDHTGSYPGVWIVEKVNPKNSIVRPEAGGRRLNAPHEMLVDEHAETGFEILPTSGFEYYSAGELVEWDDQRSAGLYVVLKDNRQRVNIALLGGEHDRYWRVPHGRLRKIDPKDVLK